MVKVNAAAMLIELMEKTNTSQRSLAKKLECSPQLFNSRLKKDTFPANDWLNAIRALGFDIKVEQSGGEAARPKTRPAGPRVSQMVDGVAYDTGKADAVCNSRAMHGDQFFMELFKDASGRFFVAYYQLWDGGYNSISPVSKSGAEFFQRRYG